MNTVIKKRDSLSCHRPLSLKKRAARLLSTGFEAAPRIERFFLKTGENALNGDDDDDDDDGDDDDVARIACDCNEPLPDSSRHLSSFDPTSVSQSKDHEAMFLSMMFSPFLRDNSSNFELKLRAVNT